MTYGLETARARDRFGDSRAQDVEIFNGSVKNGQHQEPVCLGHCTHETLNDKLKEGRQRWYGQVKEGRKVTLDTGC